MHETGINRAVSQSAPATHRIAPGYAFAPRPHRCRPSYALLAGACTLGLLAQPPTQAMDPPALEFPQAGIDDAKAYAGYRTRIYRDSRKNTFQVYLDAATGRVVNLWADAANASAGMTVRRRDGRPARLEWGGSGVDAHEDGDRRMMLYRLRAAADRVEIGWFLLGSMRQERDFQRTGWNVRPYQDGPFVLDEYAGLVASVGKLPEDEQRRHLELLRATDIGTLRARLLNAPVLVRQENRWTLTVGHVSLDGRNRLTLALAGSDETSTAEFRDGILDVQAIPGQVITIEVSVTTDNAALTPIDRQHLFTPAFENYIGRQSGAGTTGPMAARIGFRRLQRSVAGLSLLVSAEKAMAALPNYATYFGRDSMMAAMLLEAVTTPDLEESVIANVLSKVAATGEVSHEEAVGEQAIRENAVDYAALIRQWETARDGDAAAATAYLERAYALLANLQAVRENYRMIDDDFQLPVLVDRYLSRADVAASRKRRFLLGDNVDALQRRGQLLRNLALVARLAYPYVKRPRAGNLVGFQFRDDAGWIPGSWRDSRPGYGNGRFALDVNAFWVPAALEATSRIVDAIDATETTVADELQQLHLDTQALRDYATDRQALADAIETWRGARRHFEVELQVNEMHDRAAASLASAPHDEGRFWSERLRDDSAAPLRFLALALDDNGTPIPIVNTDPATSLFLEDHTGQVLAGKALPGEVLALIDGIFRNYPAGLFIAHVGPLVANDLYADAAVQQGFRNDSYHSPRTVWGRDVNLLAMGIARQLAAAYAADGRLRDDSEGFALYVAGLQDALARLQDAVDASGMQHNEVWSYRIEGDTVLPLRLPVSSDVQLWNLTDLAVRYELDRLGAH